LSNISINEIWTLPFFLFFFQTPFPFVVLGSHLWWTRYWPNWNLSRWFRFAIRKNQCLL